MAEISAETGLPVIPAEYFHDGPAPEENGLADWLAAHGDDEREMDARALEEALENASSGEEDGLFAQIEQAAANGSAWAAWVAGSLRDGSCGPLEEETDPDDVRERERSRRLLEQAARAGIGAACLTLAEQARREGDGQRTAARLVEGLRLDSPGCALALAGLWCARRVTLEEQDAARLGTLLLAAAKEGSWSSLERLLDILRDRPPLAVEDADGMRDRAFALLTMAASGGHVRAMARLGASFVKDGQLGRSPEKAELWLDRARKAGSAEAGCELAELLLGENGDPVRITRLLNESAGRGCPRASALLGREVYAHAGGRRAATAGLERMLKACREGGADACAEFGRTMCLARSEENTDLRGDGTRLLEAARENGSRKALVWLAQLGLQGLTGRELSFEEALAMLEEAKRGGCPEACGALAELFLAGAGEASQDGGPRNLEPALAHAADGWRMGDPRSMALLVLDREDAWGRGPSAGNPMTHEEADVIVPHLTAAGEPLIYVQTSLAMIGSAGDADAEAEDPGYAGFLIARCFMSALLERDTAVLRLVAAGAERLAPGDAADAAARSFASELHVEGVADREGLVSFTAWAGRNAREAAELLMRTMQIESASGAGQAAGGRKKAAGRAKRRGRRKK